MGSLHADRASRGKEVLGADDVARSLTRIAYEIIERNGGSDNLVIAGIPTRGATLARRLVNRIREVSDTYADLAIIDTTMFRDDLDVLYTGRTIKAALDALTRIGRPAAVQLAVLIDRGHRELPIRPDYVGKNLPTSRDETVTILLDETDGRDGVLLGKGL